MTVSRRHLLSGASPAHVSPLRAFPIVSRLEAGSALHRITDDAHEPHLKAGEWAVIDTADREPQFGELFLFAPGLIFSDLSLRLVRRPPAGVQIQSDEPCAWLTSLQVARSPAEAWQMLAEGRTVHTDGPIPLSIMAPAVIGRCVAIYQAARTGSAA